MIPRLLLTASLFIGSHALACSCNEAPVAENLNRAAHVFHAKVVYVQYVPIPEHLKHRKWRTHPKSPHKGLIVRITFEVVETYKGYPKEIDAIYTHVDGGLCGVGVELDDEFVFFADYELTISNCNGSFINRVQSHWEKKMHELKGAL